MADEKTQLKLIWFALSMSIVIYAVTAYVTVPVVIRSVVDPEENRPDNDDHSLGNELAFPGG